jgi:hypothetical protein
VTNDALFAMSPGRVGIAVITLNQVTIGVWRNSVLFTGAQSASKVILT